MTIEFWIVAHQSYILVIICYCSPNIFVWFVPICLTNPACIFSYPYIQGNPVPNTLDQEFVFRLSEHPDYQWTPRLTAFEFITMLSNLTAIKIRGVYNPGGKSHSLIIHSPITRIQELDLLKRKNQPSWYVTFGLSEFWTVSGQFWPFFSILMSI